MYFAAVAWVDMQYDGKETCTCVYLDEVARDVSAGDVQSSCEVGEREALIHGTDVSHTITRVYNHPSEQAYTHTGSA